MKTKTPSPRKDLMKEAERYVAKLVADQPDFHSSFHESPDEAFAILWSSFRLTSLYLEPDPIYGIAAYGVMRYLQDHPEAAEPKERTVTA